jgi:hypothetical protein
LKQNKPLEDIIVDGRIIIKLVLNRNMTGSYGLDSFVLEEGAVAGSCKQGNETSGSTNDGGIS